MFKPTILRPLTGGYWRRPAAMATAIVMAMAGLIVAQGFTSAQEAAALVPELGPSQLVLDPEPDPASPIPANGEADYQVEILGMGTGQPGGEPVPAAGAEVSFHVVPQDDAPAGGAFFWENDGSPDINVTLNDSGWASLSVVATEPGTYKLVGDSRENHQVFADATLYFEAAAAADPGENLADPAESYADIGTDTALANALNPSAAEHPEIVDGFEVYVVLADGEGYPITDVASSPLLKIRAAAGDPANGQGLFFTPADGTFACADELDPDTGECLDGAYYTFVSASVAGVRQLQVVYRDGLPGSFKLEDGNRPGSDVLLAEFVVDEGSSWDYSTLMVSPSDPENDPDDPADDGRGVPLPLPVGGSYQVTATRWDAGRNNRVPVDDYVIRLTLEGEDCHATFPNGTQVYQVRSTSEEGRLSIEVVGNEVGQCTLTWEGDSRDLPNKTKQLVWVDGPLDLASAKTWFSVSARPVLANGVDQGTIEVQLYGTNGKPSIQYADLIQAEAQPSSGISIDSFTHTGNGRYVAAYAGTAAGSYNITVKAANQTLSVQPGIGNATGTLVAPEGPPPSAARSQARITQRENQQANHDRPNSTVGEWGKQIIKVTLEDAAGNPVTNAAADLVAAVAPGDPLDGIGLYFGNEEAFACTQVPVNGECVSGVYGLDVYSSKAGERQVTVTYMPGTPNAVAIVNGDSPSSKVLRAYFVTPPASRVDSTLVVTPSDPADDPDDPADAPDGVPAPLRNGSKQRYKVIITTWDEGRNNRVGGQDVYLRLNHWDEGVCEAQVEGGDYGWHRDVQVTTSLTGRAVAYIWQQMEYPGTCKLTAELQQYRGYANGPIAGSPKVLEWTAGDEPDLITPYASRFEVGNTGPVVANGADVGTIEVDLMGSETRFGEDWIAGQAHRLAVVTPEGSGLEVSGFLDEANGEYIAYFKGTVPGDFQLQVTFDGQPLQAFTYMGVAYDTAHMLASTEQPVSAAKSSAWDDSSHVPAASWQPLPGTGNYDGDADAARVMVRLLDADGNPVTYSAGGLNWAPAASDPLGGVGLFDMDGGRFYCYRGYGGYRSCEEGYAFIEVSSTEPGPRHITVTYKDRNGEFAVANQGNPASTTVVLTFGQPDPWDQDSTLVVSPSLPVDNPNDPNDAADGVPVAIPPGQVYQITITGWGRGKTHRAAGRDDGYADFGVSILESPGCDAHFVDPSDPGNFWAWRQNFEAKLDANGQAVATVWSDNPGVCHLVATGDGEDLQGSPKVLRWLGTPYDLSADNTWYTVSGASVPADGVSAATVTVQLRDEEDGPVVDAAAAIVAIPNRPGVTVGVFSHVGWGVYTAPVTSTEPGEYSIGVQVYGEGLGSGSLEDWNSVATFVQASTVPELSGSQSVLTALTSDQTPPVGGAPHQFEATLKNQFGGLWTSPETVVFSYQLDGAATWTQGAAVTSAGGVAGWDAFNASAPGVYNVKAEVAGRQVGGIAQVKFAEAGPLPGAPSVANSWLIQPADEDTAAANGVGVQVVGAVVRDAFDDPVEGATVSFFIPEYTSVGLTAGPGEVEATTDQAGYASVTLTSPFMRGLWDPFAVTASVGGAAFERLQTAGSPNVGAPGGAPARARLNFVPRVVASGAGLSRLEWSQDPVAADGESGWTVRVVLTDQDGLPFTGGVGGYVEFYSVGEAMELDGPGNYGVQVPIGADGAAVLTVTSQVAGTFEFTAHANVTVAYDGQTWGSDCEIEEGSPAVAIFQGGTIPQPQLDVGKSSFEALSAAEPVGTDMQHRFKASLVDQNGDPWTAEESVVFSYKAEGAANWTTGPTVTTTDGVAGWDSFTSGTPGKYDVKAEVDGHQVGGTVTVEFAARVLDLTQSSFVWVTEGQTPMVGNPHKFETTLRDQFGQVSYTGRTVVYSYRAKDASEWTEGVRSGTYFGVAAWNTFTQTTPGLYEVKAELDGNQVGETVTVEFGPLPFSLEKSTFVALTAAQTPVAGTGVHVFELTLRDESGELLTGTENAVFSHRNHGTASWTTGVTRVAANGVCQYELGLPESHAGFFDVTVTVRGFQVGEILTVQFANQPEPGVFSPAESWLIQPADAVRAVANGRSTLVVGAVARDAYGEPMQSATVKFAFPQYTSAGLSTGPGEVTAVTDGSGYASVSLTSPFVSGEWEPLLVSATVGGAAFERLLIDGQSTASASDGSPVAAALNFVPREVTSGEGLSRLEWSEQPVIADGESEWTVKAVLTDQDGVPFTAGEGSVVFTSVGEAMELGGAGAYSVTVPIDADGAASLTVTSQVAGTFQFTAQAEVTASHEGESWGSQCDISVGSPASVVFQDQPPEQPHLDLSRSSFEKLTEGDTQVIGEGYSPKFGFKVSLVDQYGDPWTAAETVVFSYKAEAGSTWAVGQSVPAGAGVAEWDSFTAAQAGVYQVKAEVGGSAVGSVVSVSFVAAALDPAGSVFECLTCDDAVVVGSPHKLQLTLRDQFGGPWLQVWRQGAPVVLSYRLVGQSVWTQGYSGTPYLDVAKWESFTVSAPGSYEVKAEFNNVQLGQTVVVEFAAPTLSLDLEKSSLVWLTQSRVVYPGDPHGFRVLLVDQYGDPWTTPGPVVFSYRAVGGSAWTVGATVTTAGGAAEWGSFTSTSVGSYEVKAEVVGSQVGSTVTVQFVPIAPPPPALDLGASSLVWLTQSQVVYPGEPHGFRVSLVDQYGAAWASSESVVFSYRAAGATAWIVGATEATNVSGVAEWGSFTVAAPGSYEVKAEVGAFQVGSVVTVEFEAPDLDLDAVRASFAYSTGPVDPAGAGHWASVVVSDVLGGLVGDQAVSFELSPAGSAFFADAASGAALGDNPLVVSSSDVGAARVSVRASSDTSAHLVVRVGSEVVGVVDFLFVTPTQPPLVDLGASSLVWLTQGRMVYPGDPHGFRVLLVDQYGDPWTTPVPVEFSYRAVGGSAWTVGATVTTAGGAAEWGSFTSTSVGSYEVRAEVVGVQVGSTVTVQFVPIAPPPPALDLGASSFVWLTQGLVPVVGSAHGFRVSLVDQYGAAWATPESVVFSHRAEGATAWTVGVSLTTNASGAAEWGSFTVASPGSYEVKAEVGGSQVGSTAVVEFAAPSLDFDAVRASFAYSTGSVDPAGGVHWASVVVSDVLGGLVEGRDVSFELSGAGSAFLVDRVGGSVLANPAVIASSGLGAAAVGVRAT
ncbi:MAG: hypothetical protein LBC97_04115, partial [Bifidobacteriaceae bacterium]|nr:hypothetical protein [Bifidobacteriaceae bacterium]